MTRWIAPIALLAACTPVPDAEIVDTIDLGAHLDFAPEPTGVAVDADALFVLDARRGLFAWTGDGLDPVATADDLIPLDSVAGPPFTDVVSLGDGQFSVTVQNDGLLLDLDTGTTEQHGGLTWVDDGVAPPYFVIVGNDGTVMTAQYE